MTASYPFPSAVLAKTEPLERRPAPTQVRGLSRCGFSDLMVAELPWVWRVLRRIGLSPADADDASQQVFLVAARRLGELRADNPRPFLYATALRVAANVRRGLSRRQEEPSLTLETRAQADGPAPEQLIEQRRARQLLDELLQQLPPELRRILILTEIEELGGREIAELEGLPLGTVASRLRRARKRFFALLEQHQGIHRPCDRHLS